MTLYCAVHVSVRASSARNATTLGFAPSKYEDSRFCLPGVVVTGNWRPLDRQALPASPFMLTVCESAAQPRRHAGKGAAGQPRGYSSCIDSYLEFRRDFVVVCCKPLSIRAPPCARPGRHPTCSACPQGFALVGAEYVQVALLCTICTRGSGITHLNSTRSHKMAASSVLANRRWLHR